MDRITRYGDASCFFFPVIFSLRVVPASKQSLAEHVIRHSDVMRQNCRPKTKLAVLTSGRFRNYSGGNHMEIKMSDESLKVAASTAGGGAAGTAGSLAAVSTLGAVEGLSAAGMTSGLAALGSLVGGGMAAGIGVAAAPVLAGGALAAALTSDNIETDEKIAAGVGAGAGIAGSVATVSAAGAVGGLSAAGITSGLAAIGGVVGGGMATGVAITCAAPLAVAGGAYALYKWLKD